MTPLQQQLQPINRIVFIGAGNLATRLSIEMKAHGFEVAQVWSRTEASARTLASRIGAPYTTAVDEIVDDADLYIFAVKDTALADLIAAMPHRRGLWVHTAGSVDLDIFASAGVRHGVFYPLQTFSKARRPDFSEIPIFIEAATEADRGLLYEAAARITSSVIDATSEQRRHLHLAAVFACNFTNHMYAIAARLVEEHNLPFEALRPLIKETAAKIEDLTPLEAQTGPAIRFDEAVISRHLALLDGEPDLQAIYGLVSRSIHAFSKPE